MDILMISSDRKLFEEGSDVAGRMAAYGEQCGTIRAIVFTTREHEAEVRQIAENVWAYPTNSRNRWFYIWDAWRMARQLDRADVVTTQDPFEAGVAGWLVARTKKIPLHVQIHTDFLSRGFVRGTFLNRIRRVFARLILPRAAHIRVVSNRIRDSLVTRNVQFASKTTVLPIYIDVDQYANLPREKHARFKISLLAVGRLEPEKRFELAIDSLAIARKAGHDVGLTIVGSGKEESILRVYAERRGVTDRVVFAGWQNDLQPYYATTDLVLVTSQYEGYGLVTAEALAAGIPVLSMDVGIARESGAMVVRKLREFPKALLQWIADGPRQGGLKNYPYRSFEEYVEHWCEDVRKAAQARTEG